MRAAVVTGGGTGIGYACAQQLVQRGFGVLLCGRREKILRAAAQSLRRLKLEPAVQIETLACDVSDYAASDEIVETCVRHFGRIDVLINNAGIWREVPFTELRADAWEEMLAITLIGPALTSSAAAKQMIAQGGGGRIVHISSVSGIVAEPGWAHYSSGKAGLLALTRAMAVELAAHGIRTNAVCPGWIETDITREYFETIDLGSLGRVNSVGRVGTPAEVAVVVAFLCVDAPDFVNGEVMTVDGGQVMMASMPASRLAARLQPTGSGEMTSGQARQARNLDLSQLAGAPGSNQAGDYERR